MPIVVQCPSCDRRLKVPDHLLGKSVRCPTCQTTFQATEADEPAGPEAGAEEAPPEKPARRRAAPPPDDGVEERPSRSGRRRARPVDEEEEDQDRDNGEEEEDEERPRRRRQRGRRRRGSDAAAAVAAPAIALMITAGVGIGFSVLALILNLLGVSFMAANGGGPGGRPGNPDPAGNAVTNVIGAIVGICWGGIVISGALKMKNLQSWGYALAACIVAMLPCNACCLLGIPFGIWGLVVICRGDVKDAFE
jgi:predicted Zn finger-like uncharacterized protein